MSDFKRLAIPRELWRQAMPTAPERVIRALETLSDYYDDTPDSDSNTTIDISLSSGNSTAALEQIQALESAINDLQLETALASTLPVSQQEQDDEETLRSSPEIQAAAQFIANSTPIQFTPTVIGLTTAGVGTYIFQIGNGQLIGNRFEFSIAVGWTAHTGTGGIAISGLPFLSNNVPDKLPCFSIMAENLTYSGQLCSLMLPGVSNIRVASFSSGTPITVVPMDTSALIYITGSYEV